MARYKEKARHAAAAFSKVVTDGVIDGAAISTGLVLSGWLGRTVEDTVKKGVTKDSSTSDKLIAYLSNATPKLALWYLAYRMMPESENPMPDKTGSIPTETVIVSDFRKALLGSFVLDTLMRASKGFGSPDKLTLFGINFMGNADAVPAGNSQSTNPEMQNNLQRVIQQNSALRTELNKALQRASEQSQQIQQQSQQSQRQLSPAPVVQVQQPQIQYQQPQIQYQQAPPVVRVQPQPIVQMQQPAVQQANAPVMNAPVIQHEDVPGRQKKYGFMEDVPVRQKKYGFMPGDTTPPGMVDRQKKYGFMSGEGKEADIGAIFGML